MKLALVQKLLTHFSVALMTLVSSRVVRLPSYRLIALGVGMYSGTLTSWYHPKLIVFGFLTSTAVE